MFCYFHRVIILNKMNYLRYYLLSVNKLDNFIIFSYMINAMKNRLNNSDILHVILQKIIFRFRITNERTNDRMKFCDPKWKDNTYQ